MTYNATQAVTAEEIRDALQDEFIEEQTDRKKKPERADNYMSQIGETCIRRLFYERTAQHKKQPYPTHVLRKMREGRRQEIHTINDLSKLGFEWIKGQDHVAIHDLSLTGHIEGYTVRSEGSRKNATLSEIKSMSENAFRSHQTIEAIDDHQFFRRYLDQCSSYMAAESQETCILFLKDRGGGDVLPLQYDFDVERWKLLIEKAKEVNTHVELDEAPDRINGGCGDDTYCKSCQFNILCLPDVIADGEALKFIDAPEVAEKLRRLEELKTVGKELEALKKWRKDRFKNLDRVVIEEFLITGAETSRKGYEVQPVTYWTTKVTTIKKGD